MKKGEKWAGQPFLIGRYQLGYRVVNLWAEPGKGGAWFNLCKGGTEEAQIHVHMEDEDPAYAFSHLCHEIWEMALDDQHAVFHKSNAFMDSASDACHFFYDHNQHTEVSCRASFFVWKCMEAFKAAHAKFKEHREAAEKQTLAKKRLRK